MDFSKVKQIRIKEGIVTKIRHVTSDTILWVAKILTTITDKFPLLLEKSTGEELVDYKIYGESVQATEIELYNDDLWKDGFISFEGAYPETSTDYPNSKYFVLKLKVGQQIRMNVIDGVGNRGRVRYINPENNTILGTVSSGDNDNWVMSINTESSGFKNTIFHALQDVSLGFVQVEGVTTEITSLLWQNAEPTPETPIEIESVGEVYPIYQKMDGNYANRSSWSLNQYVSIKDYNASFNGSASLNSILMRSVASINISCIENHKYLFRITAKCNFNTRVIQVNLGNWRYIDSIQDGNYHTYSLFGTATTSKSFGSDDVRISQCQELTPKDNCYFECNRLEMFDLTEMYGAGNEPTTIEQFKTDYPDEYYPRFEGNKYKVPVKVSGKNLFDGVNRTVITQDMVGKTYTYSIGDTSDWRAFKIKDLYTTNPATVVITQDLVGSLIQVIKLNYGTMQVHDCVTNKYQEEEGTTATSYEPYFEPYTKNIYLNEPLRKIGDYADYVDFENRKVVRNVLEKRLTGEESFLIPTKSYIKSDATDSYINDYTILKQIYHSSVVLSNMVIVLKNTSAIWATVGCQNMIQINGNQIHINISNELLGITDYSSETTETALNKYKNYIKQLYDKGDPMKVYAPLATPTEESIELPDIPTQQGTNIITIDTKIQPDKGTVSYYKK